MRFTIAWANVISENQILKIVLFSMMIIVFGLSFVCVKLGAKKPLLIERACYSRSLTASENERTQTEIEAFIREALSFRFDTGAQDKPGYLDEQEEKFRLQEQQEFKKRDIKQKIIVNKVTTDGKTATVDMDRILSVGNVKTVLPFFLALTLGIDDRTDGNPYGLVLLKVTSPKIDDIENGGKK